MLSSLHHFLRKSSNLFLKHTVYSSSTSVTKLSSKIEFILSVTFYKELPRLIIDIYPWRCFIFHFIESILMHLSWFHPKLVYCYLVSGTGKAYFVMGKACHGLITWWSSQVYCSLWWVNWNASFTVSQVIRIVELKNTSAETLWIYRLKQ